MDTGAWSGLQPGVHSMSDTTMTNTYSIINTERSVLESFEDGFQILKRYHLKLEFCFLHKSDWWHIFENNLLMLFKSPSSAFCSPFLFSLFLRLLPTILLSPCLLNAKWVPVLPLFSWPAYSARISSCEQLHLKCVQLCVYKAISRYGIHSTLKQPKQAHTWEFLEW